MPSMYYSTFPSYNFALKLGGILCKTGIILIMAPAAAGDSINPRGTVFSFVLFLFSHAPTRFLYLIWVSLESVVSNLGNLCFRIMVLDFVVKSFVLLLAMSQCLFLDFFFPEKLYEDYKENYLKFLIGYKTRHHVPYDVCIFTSIFSKISLDRSLSYIYM